MRKENNTTLTQKHQNTGVGVVDSQSISPELHEFFTRLDALMGKIEEELNTKEITLNPYSHEG